MNDVKLNTFGNSLDLTPDRDDSETGGMLANNTTNAKDPLDTVVMAPPAPPNGTQVNKTDQAKSRRRKRCGQAWYDFCEATTLHGLRQVVEPQPYITRRLIWITLVLIGCTLFGYQMITGILYYYSYPVSVNVRINYNNTLMFPALTICNQNAFRKTVTAEQGWYESVAEAFAHKGHAPRNPDAYNDTDMTVYELYDTAGHALQDLIVSCKWDGYPCNVSEFQVQMTDYGKCYTFNADEPYKEAKRTGTEGGLQLLLNVEQYEYMPGPNQGAGLRVLLHNHNDAPLVRDFGVAVPPGSYSLLGTTMIRIKNLPDPHGECDNTNKLTYYESYTKQNCLQNCEQLYVEENCGCRLIYMVNKNENYSRCTLQEAQDCQEILEHFNKVERSQCRCSIPCDVDSLEFFNSIGDISTFDALNLLDSELTDQLSPRFSKAQEVTQRVNKQTVQNDEKLVSNVASSIKAVEGALDEILEGIRFIEEYTMDQVFQSFEKRIQFHKVKGLEKVLYIMEHDFVRGWTILEERTLPYLTFNCLELRGTFHRVIDRVRAARNGTEMEQFLAMALWADLESKFLERLDIAVRVKDNVTEVHEGYKTGDPPLTYRSSLNRRYDMTWITVELLQANVDDDSHNQDKIYSEIFRRMNQYTTSLRNYMAMGRNFTETYEIDADALNSNNKLFRSGCIFYNYNVFLYKTRIVDGPVLVINERIEEFDRRNRTLYEAKDKLLVHLQMIKRSIAAQKNTTWREIYGALSEASAYLNNTNATKAALADFLTSPAMTTAVRDLELFFSTLRSAGREMDEKILEFRLATEKLWENMLMEYSTERFYKKVHEDFVASKTDKDFYLPYFANLLDVDVSDLENTTADELEYRMNADFSVTNLTTRLADIRDKFQRLDNFTRIGKILGVKDEVFLSSVASLVTSLRDFLQKTVIDIDFYRSNFIQLSVFMQELSYEEIIQQPAYDTLNLLGDIGGSVGLFLGASALTLAEILDVIILQIVNSFR